MGVEIAFNLIFSVTLIAKNMPKKDVIPTLGSPTALALAGSFQAEEDMSDVDEGSILSEALEEEISKILHEEDSDDEKPIQVEKIDIQNVAPSGKKDSTMYNEMDSHIDDQPTSSYRYTVTDTLDTIWSLMLWISHFRLYCPPIFRLILHYAFELFVALSCSWSIILTGMPQLIIKTDKLLNSFFSDRFSINKNKNF